MKKIAVISIAIILLMASSQVLADGVSRVGKKVGSEALLLIDGEPANNVIIVDGKSYAPVRDIVEVFGGAVEWVEGKGGEQNMVTVKKSIVKSGLVVTVADLEKKKDNFLNQERDTKKLIESYEDNIVALVKEKEQLINTIDGMDLERRKAPETLLRNYDEWISENEIKVADLKIQLDELRGKILEVEDEMHELSSK